MDTSEVEEIIGTGVAFKERFGAKDYIQNYYSPLENPQQLVEMALTMHQDSNGNYMINEIVASSEATHEIIENVAVFDFFRIVTEHFLEEYPGGTARILDVGGGPTIYQHIGLALIARTIFHSEYLESNRNEVHSWLINADDAHNWDSYFRLVQHLFKLGDTLRILDRLQKDPDESVQQHARLVHHFLHAESVESYKDYVRECIKGHLIHGDIFQEDLGLKDSAELFDIITSNFVVESASENKSQWEKGMKNIISNIKVGGYLLQTAIKNASWYQVGGERLPAFSVDARMIQKICEDQGLHVIHQKVLEGSNAVEVGYDGMIFTLAKKMR